jgi:copper homeostasis protein
MISKLEIACFDLDAALIAADFKVDRIEFTANYNLGGTTPSLEDFKKLRAYTSLPIFPLVRCRGGNFTYSVNEMEEMTHSILQLADLGADGIVVGCLTDSNEINLEQARAFKQCAPHLPFTFHRGFDHVTDSKKALEQLIELGYSNILTSGCKTAAINGINHLIQLSEWSANRIEFVVGGGIRSTNIEELKQNLQPSYFHSACITDTSEKINPTELQKILSIIRAQ